MSTTSRVDRTPGGQDAPVPNVSDEPRADDSDPRSLVDEDAVRTVVVSLEGLRQSAVALETAGDLEGAARQWDRLLRTSQNINVASTNEVLGGMARRAALPVPVPANVLSAATAVLSGLPPELAAGLFLDITVAGFDAGLASYADLLRATAPFSEYEKWAPDERRLFARGAGYRASVLLHLRAADDAEKVLHTAARAVGLRQTPSVDEQILAEAVERLATGNRDPVLQLGEVPDDPELPAWLRQLEADCHAQRGDLATSVALYQSLWCFYGFRGGAMAFTAGQVALTAGHFDAAERILTGLHNAEPELFRLQPLMAVTAGLAKLALHRIAEAREYAARVPEVLGAAEGDLHLLHARIKRAEGDVAAASQRYLDAVVEKLRPRREALGYRFDATTMREVIPVADEAVAFLAEAGRPVDVLRLSELVKSSRLRTILARRSDEPSRILGRTGEGPRSAELRALLDALAHQIGRLERQIIGSVSAPDALRSQLSDLQEQRRRALDEFCLNDPAWWALTREDMCDVEALEQQCRSHHVAALSFYRIGSRVVSVLVDEHGVDLGETTLRDDVMGAIDTYTGNLTVADGVESWNDPAMLGLALQDFLPDELINRVTAARCVVIAAHRQLHLLPWAAMPFGGCRLLNYVPVSVTPNLSCLAHLLSPPGTGTIALFGPPSAAGDFAPLSAGSREVSDIAHTVGDDRVCERIDGDRAGASALTNLLGRRDVDVVHLICHGTPNPEEPLSSGFVLAGGEVLDAADLLDITISASEIVASACSIGWRPDHVGPLDLLGDEALGLPAALLASGVQVLVVPITRVSDVAAARISVAYHSHRRAGSSPPEALRQAQIELLSDRALPPSEWCGFVVYGSPFSPVDVTESKEKSA